MSTQVLGEGIETNVSERLARCDSYIERLTCAAPYIAEYLTSINVPKSPLRLMRKMLLVF